MRLLHCGLSENAALDLSLRISEQSHTRRFVD